MTTWNMMFFSPPSSVLMELVIFLHDYIMMFLFSVMILVFMNLVYSFISMHFNYTFFVNHQLETIWTLIPFFLLMFMLLPSLFSLYMLDTCIFCGLTLSIVGHQWYWSYYIKDFLYYSLESYMVSEGAFLRLLDTDNRLLVPVHTPIRFLVTSSDVLHSWSLPSLGVKMDAVPGRINQFCCSLKRSGVFFGQCSEICGINHSFMPIVLEVSPFKNFMSSF